MVFLLLGLPAELREQIFQAAFACADRHASCVWNGLLLTLVDGRIYKRTTYTPFSPSASKICGASALPLLRTSKALYREALPIFHRSLNLQLHVDGRYRSPVELKSLDLGAVEDVAVLRNVRHWDVTIRLNSSEVDHVERLLSQLESLQTVAKVNTRIEWQSISVQLSRYAEAPEQGQRVLEAVKAMTGVNKLEEIQDPWREMTTVFDYQAPAKHHVFEI